MPVQRETSTNIPKVESSSFKGALREHSEELFTKKEWDSLFGIKENAGLISFTDLRLLFFPVKSSRNIFSLITCPYILERFYEDNILYNKSFKISGLKELVVKLNTLSTLSTDETYVIDSFEGNIYLGEHLFKTKELISENLFNNIKELKKICKKIVILSDENLIDFTRYYTEVVTRNRIDKETRTTKSTGLFTEEYVPAGAIFYGMILRFDNILTDKREQEELFNSFLTILSNKNVLGQLQIGGNSTLGKGILSIIN